MNSRVSVDAEDGLCGSEEEGKDFGGFEDQSASCDGQAGKVVLVLPTKETEDCIPVMVNGVPVFISHTGSGSPLYIRQYPPTLDEIMVTTSEDLVTNFDGFSEASGQTFEGFSEASSSSVLFEGFLEDANEDTKNSVTQNHRRITKKGVDGTQYHRVPSTSKKKPATVGARRSSGQKRKRSPEKGSPEKQSPRKRVAVKTEKSESNKTVYQRRLSSEKSDSDGTVIELVGRKPRHLPSPGDADYIGEYCNAIGCTVSFLERMGVKDVKINNGVIQELTNFARRISWEDEYIVRWIQRLSGLKTAKPVDDADKKSIQAVLKRRKAVSTIHAGKQNHKAKLKAYDEVEYILPSVAKEKEIPENDFNASVPKTKKGQKAGEEERKGAKKGSNKKSENKNDAARKRSEKGSVVEENTTNEITTKAGTEEGSRAGMVTVKDEAEIKEEYPTNKGNQKNAEKNMEIERRITSRRTSGIRKEKEEEDIKEEKESSEDGKENEAAERTDKNMRMIITRRASVLETREKEKASEKGKECHENEKKNEDVGKNDKMKRQMATRRASVLALQEKEKQTIQENSIGTGMSRSTRRKSLLLNDQEKQVGSKAEVNAADRKRTEVGKQEDRWGASANQTDVATPGRRISTRRSSMLKGKEGTEKAVPEKDKTEQREYNQRQRRESSNIKENKKPKNKNEATEDDKLQVKEAKSTPGKTRGTERRVSTRRGSIVIPREEETAEEVKEEETDGEEAEKKTIEALDEENKSDGEEDKEASSEKTKNEKEAKQDKTDEIDENTDLSLEEEDNHFNRKVKTAGKKRESQSSKEETPEETAAATLTEEAKNGEACNTGKEIISEEEQFIVKRNKVINRDKRISRWQNKKLAQHEKTKSPTKGELPIKRELAESDEVEEHDKPHDTSSYMTGDTSLPSDDESEGNLEIDESLDDMHTDDNSRDESVNDMQIDDVGSSVNEGEDSGDDSANDTDVEEVNSCTEYDEDFGGKEPTPKVTTTPGSTEATPKPRATESAYTGTLGVSKSGRLRKASVKGIQSIEIKCLFMQRDGKTPHAPPVLPTSKDDQRDEDWRQEKRMPTKREPSRDLPQSKKSPVKQEPKPCKSIQSMMVLGPKGRSYSFNKTDNEFLTYTQQDGHLVPKFRETDFCLGEYCAQGGLTVDDLNSDKVKDIKMTIGMIKELHDFYVSRKATKTALAIRLFKMMDKKLVDNTHLLSTVMRITNIGRLKSSEFFILEREFLLPNRITSPDQPVVLRERPKKTLVSNPLTKTPKARVPNANRYKKSPKKRAIKPEDSGDEYDECVDVEEKDKLDKDTLVTFGQKGAITRGDIVHLYSRWLSNKMSQGSNTFVTDLLHSVEQLMAQRQVAPLRIPAGTLMSSSVKLYDEYKQIFGISKEDAIMYLQEDWLEDIKYLVSMSGPPRRNTSDGEPGPLGTTEGETSAVEKHSKARTHRHHSGRRKEDSESDYEGEPLSNIVPFSCTIKGELRSHQMESVGKRKRRSIRESLDKYEKEILKELEESGDLEEEEEDILQQLNQEEEMSESELQEEIKKQLKKNREKRILEENSVKSKRQKGDGSHEVQKIVDFQEVHDKNGKHFRYLVRWVGCGPQDDSWVNEANLCRPKLVQDFWKGNKSTQQDRSEPSMEDGDGTKSDTEVGESKDEESIIQVMVKQGMSKDTATSSDTPVVTKRELLGLYDAWREENQKKLSQGSSNTVNVEEFKGRIKELMTSKGVKFHPESILNACFMMTLMKTRLQSSCAVNQFLETSCLEELESSQRQYLKRKYTQMGDILSSNHLKQQKPSLLNLQNELRSLKLDLTIAQKWRVVKNSQLGAVEEEVDCLENVLSMPENRKAEAALYINHEVGKIKVDLKGLLERSLMFDSNKKAAKTDKDFFFSTADEETKTLKTKLLQNELEGMSLARNTINSIMDIVAQRVEVEQKQE